MPETGSHARVACDRYVTMGMIIVGGEITAKAMFDVAKVVREVGNEIGYTSPMYGYDVNTGAISGPFTPSRPTSTRA